MDCGNWTTTSEEFRPTMGSIGLDLSLLFEQEPRNNTPFTDREARFFAKHNVSLEMKTDANVHMKAEHG